MNGNRPCRKNNSSGYTSGSDPECSLKLHMANSGESSTQKSEDCSLSVALHAFFDRKDGREEIARFFSERLKEMFRKHVRLNEEDENRGVLTVDESFGFSCMRKELTGTSAAWATKLLQITFSYFNSLMKYNIPRHERPVQVASSPLFFPRQLITAHQDVHLAAVSYGSLVNHGTRAIHWRVAYFDEFGGSLHDRIKADFEYDRGLIQVYFVTIEPVETIMTEIKHRLRLEVPRIRRILVDATSIQGDSETFKIHFLIDFVEINIFRRRNVERNEGKMPKRKYEPSVEEFRKLSFGDRDRRTWIGRGENSGEFSSPLISECNLVTFEIAKSTWQRGDDLSLISGILGRLRHVTRRPIEFVTLDALYMLYPRDAGATKDPRSNDRTKDRAREVSTVYRDPFGRRRDILLELLKETKESHSWLGGEKDGSLKSHAEVKYFRLRCLLEGLLHRGAFIKVQLLTSRSHWEAFLTLVCREYHRREQRVLFVLEQMLSVASELSGAARPVSVHALFMNLLNQSKSDEDMMVFSPQMKADGYTRVHKVVITPTRVVYVGAEVLMTNRVLSRYNKNGTNVIRVSFRDDNTELMRVQSTGEKIIRATIGVALKRGFQLAGRKYSFIGSSNSQLRDHGAYFLFEDSSMTVSRVRRELGSFSILESVPKMMARLGQCFTQARPSKTTLKCEEFGVVPEVVGGCRCDQLEHLPNCKPYEFSDGVGCISVELAEKLHEEHDKKWRRTPAVFQVRHCGAKGIVSVNPLMDRRNRLVESLASPSSSNAQALHCLFRPSQNKFEVNDEEDTPIEVVKLSTPTPLRLNRPLINILDQVSANQSPVCHASIVNRINELLFDKMTEMARSLYEENHALFRLQDLPSRCNVEMLKHEFLFTTEPYFRSLLQAAYKFTLQKQLARHHVEIPPYLGRTMFGMMDETGLLQSGQVFVQYSTDLHGGVASTIHTGRVLITKNPSTVAGDVRMFEAVDVGDLRHLVDVVVFPRHGPRPHPDEMAGSDLDGDEYSVIWDERLFFDYNETAMRFPTGDSIELEKPSEDHERLNQQMASHYIKFVEQDPVGVFSNAHLALSDSYGIDSPVCHSVAVKQAQALDFQKTGDAPGRLTTQWTEEFPPEKPDRKPHFMQKYRDPVYKSGGLVEQLFLEITNATEMLDTAVDREEIVKDEDIHVDKWKKYEEAARRLVDSYNSDIRKLLDEYGIESEAELLSGCILNISNRISEKEVDDMSFFNTNTVIEEKLMAIIRQHRVKFFETFGEYRKILQKWDPHKMHLEQDDVMNYYAANPEDKWKQKAVAVYHVAYEKAIKTRESGHGASRLLSCPWIFYDILVAVKRGTVDKRRRNATEFEEESKQWPVAQKLSAESVEVSKDIAHSGAFSSLIKSFQGHGSPDGALIHKFITEYKGLGELLFVLLRWAERESLLSLPSSSTPTRRSNITHLHFAALFILFGMQKIGKASTKFLYMPVGEHRELSAVTGGRLMFEFVLFLSSSAVAGSRVVSLGCDEPLWPIHSLFVRGEWHAVRKAAVGFSMHMVFNQCIGLPLAASKKSLRVPLTEMTPFVIELPPMETTRHKLRDLASMIRDKTGVLAVNLRQIGNRTNVLVSALGTRSSIRALKDQLVVSPPFGRESEHCQAVSRAFAVYVFYSITGRFPLQPSPPPTAVV